MNTKIHSCGNPVAYPRKQYDQPGPYCSNCGKIVPEAEIRERTLEEEIAAAERTCASMERCSPKCGLRDLVKSCGIKGGP
jgi:hypothetical protein